MTEGFTSAEEEAAFWQEAFDRSVREGHKLAEECARDRLAFEQAQSKAAPDVQARFRQSMGALNAFNPEDAAHIAHAIARTDCIMRTDPITPYLNKHAFFLGDMARSRAKLDEEYPESSRNKRKREKALAEYGAFYHAAEDLMRKWAQSEFKRNELYRVSRELDRVSQKAGKDAPDIITEAEEAYQKMKGESASTAETAD